MQTGNRRFGISDDCGATGIIVALLLPILLAFGALAVDGALWLALQRQLQTAADAGAIAAAEKAARKGVECPIGAARSAARLNGVQIGGKNKSQLLLFAPLDEDGNISECERGDDGYTVEISRPAPLLLAASLLDDPIRVGARAKAECSCASNNGRSGGPEEAKANGKGKGIEDADDSVCTHGKPVCRLVPTSE